MTTKVTQNINAFYNRFNQAYAIKKGDVDTYLAHTLLSLSSSDNLGYFFQKPSEFLSSVRYYPIKFNEFFPSSSTLFNVYTGTKEIKNSQNQALQGYYLSQLNGLTSFYTKCKIAEISISRRFNNFLDFNPYTKIEIHIPFTSPIELNPIDVYGKVVSIYCFPDLNTGKGTIYVENNDRILYIGQANISVDIPIGSTNAVEILRNQVNNTFSLASGISQGLMGASGKNDFSSSQGLSLINSSIINSINGNVVHYTSKGVGSGVGNMFNPLNVYSVIRYPKLVNTTAFQSVQYRHLYGKPLMEVKDLISLSGYTEIEEIHLTGFDSALDVELQEIYQLLKEGVILN